MKRKPAGERELVEFTRRVIRTPGWLVKFHSRAVEIDPTSQPVKGEWVSPPREADGARVLYYLHGGGYVSGSGKQCRPITATLARHLNARVFALDYRLAPEHPFPAALDDAVAGFRWLVSLGLEPRMISVAGDSAGGGLALALAMKLRYLDEALPSSIACLSPWTDMAGTGESISANSENDPLFCREDVERYASLCLGEQARQTPLASPLYGDCAGLPPLLFHVGEGEMLLDDARKVHAKVIAAGGSSALRTFKGVPHDWQLLTPLLPEARKSLREIAAFISRYWPDADETADESTCAARSNRYAGSMTLLEARALFFSRSGLGFDGGYGARWVRIETKPVPVYFPNTACRVEAAKLHDLHHIAMEYETDWPGEAEIAGWEIASGCGRHGWAWLLNLGAFAIGMVLFPKRLFRAFVRGRRAANLYREGFPESELSTKSVAWLREKLGIDGADFPPRFKNRLAFAFWCVVAFAYHSALPVAGLIVLLKLLW
jgi:monoterpene epsilon-lactone hydrolase